MDRTRIAAHILAVIARSCIVVQGRPFLVVSRDAANVVMRRVLVAPVTRRVRGLPSELELGPAEGLPVVSALAWSPSVSGSASRRGSAARRMRRR